MRITTGARLAAGLLTLAFVVTACGSATSTPVPQEAAEEAACAAIQTWSDEMRAYAALDPSTVSMDEVVAQQDRVKASLQAVVRSLEAVDTADDAAFVAAAQDLEAAIDAARTSDDPAAAKADVVAAAEAVKDVYREIADGLECAIATPY